MFTFTDIYLTDSALQVGRADLQSHGLQFEFRDIFSLHVESRTAPLEVAKGKATLWYCVHTTLKHWPCLWFLSIAFPHLQVTNQAQSSSFYVAIPDILLLVCWVFWRFLEEKFSLFLPNLENRQILVVARRIPADKTMEQGNKSLSNSGLFL